MGCASSQASTVSTLPDITTEKNNTTPSSQAETVIADNIEKRRDSTPSSQTTNYPPAEAFEIPLDDQNDSNESIIKKHPPKRLQRLTEPSSTPTTIEDLEEKLAKAEIRRQKFLQQKVEGAYNSVATRIIGDKNYGNDADDDEVNNQPADEDANDSDDVKMRNSKSLRPDNDGNNERTDNPQKNTRDWIRTE